MRLADTSTTARFLVLMSALAPGVGCEQEDDEPGYAREEVAGTPEILALSTYSAPLGTPIQFYGRHFRNDIDERGRQPFAEAHFSGVFDAHDGTTTEVDATEELIRNVDGRLVLTSLGPYEHPFSDRKVVGTFRGTIDITFFEVTAGLTRGEVIAQSEPQELEFTIEPSVFITSFKPIDAACVAPVRAALAEVPYEIGAQAVGFEAESFRFTMIGAPQPFDDGRTATIPEPVVLDAPAIDNVAEVGFAGNFRAPRMPYQASSYALTVTATARGIDGLSYETQFGLASHNPVVIYDDGPAELAQTYEPIAIGSCQEGAVAPTKVTYVDSKSVTRARTESRTNTDSFSRALASGKTVALGETTNQSSSYSAQKGQSNTEGFEHSHTFGVKLNKEITVGKGFFQGKYGVEVNTEHGFSMSRSSTSSFSETNSNSQSFGTTSTTTDTETLTNTQAQARTAGTSETQSSTELNSFSISADIFPGTGAVWYRQESRYIQRGVIVRYTLCGEEKVIGETSFPDYRWSVELAAGPSCTPLPQPTDLQPARCYLPPCNSN